MPSQEVSPTGDAERDRMGPPGNAFDKCFQTAQSLEYSIWK